MLRQFNNASIYDILKRKIAEENLHDTVIKAIEKIVNVQTEYDVWTNLGSQKNMGVDYNGDTLHPDIMFSMRTTPIEKFLAAALRIIRKEKLVLVIEVEKDNTVSEDSAIKQWRPYSDLEVPFCLVVPYEKLSLAKRLCMRFGINVARFGCYTTDVLGNYEGFAWE